MQRYIFRAPIVRWYGLYFYQHLALEQAQVWLDQGPPPVVRHPSLVTVITALTGQHPTAEPTVALRMRQGDEALVVERQSEADTADLTVCVEQASFGLLRMVACMSPFTTRIAEQDLATFTLPGQRTIQTHAWLDEPGAYAYALLDRFSAQAWLAAGPYWSRLRHDVIRRALAQLTCSDILFQESGEAQSAAMVPGDQALVYHLAFPPGEARPKPYELDPRCYSLEYLLAQSEIGHLARLNDTFFEQHEEHFPYAQAVPRLRVRSAVQDIQMQQ